LTADQAARWAAATILSRLEGWRAEAGQSAAVEQDTRAYTDAMLVNFEQVIRAAIKSTEAQPVALIVQLPREGVRGIDTYCTSLAMATKFGPVRGGELRGDRDALAACLGPGPVADLLKSDRGVSVRSNRPAGWEVRAWPAAEVPSGSASRSESGGRSG
jgi:hypothetical protein